MEPSEPSVEVSDASTSVPPAPELDLRPLKILSYTVQPLAPLYRAMLSVFTDAKTRYRIHLRPEQVEAEIRRRGLPVEIPETGLGDALEQLKTWGNLRRTHDTRRVATLAEFHRRHFLYQLTPEGEVAERAVGEISRALEESGSLQTVMLSAMLRGLGALEQEMEGPQPRADRLYEALFNIHRQFEALTANASTFMVRLDTVLDAAEIGEESFLAYKGAVIAYLRDFIHELAELEPHIVRRLRDLTQRAETFCDLAASADEAPALLGERNVNTELLHKWQGIVAWFIGRDGEVPTVEMLRGAARQAINRILSILERLHEKRVRRQDRSADLVRLAEWFEDLGRREDPEALHRLFQNAFSLYSARHFSGLGEEPEHVPKGLLSWWNAPVVEVETTLRQRGRRAVRGRAGRMVDHGKARRKLRDEHVARRRRDDEALASLVDVPARRLSELPRLGEDELRLLLSILDRLLAAPKDSDGIRHARSRDGRLRLRLDPPQGETVVESKLGRLTLPDFFLHVEDLHARIPEKADV